MERCAKILIGEKQWSISNDLKIHGKTPIDIKRTDDDESFEVYWEFENQCTSNYFDNITYCDYRMTNRHEISFNDQKEAIEYVKSEIIAAIKVHEREIERLFNLHASI